MKVKVNQVVLKTKINERQITVKLISDDQPEIDLAFQLWYEISIEEKSYPIDLNISHQEKKLFENQVGALLLIATDDETGECIGTERFCFENTNALEFDYQQYNLEKPLGEITKLFVQNKYRKTALTPILLILGIQVSTEHYGKYTLVINAFEQMKQRYQELGFSEITTEAPVFHPKIGKQCFLFHCSSDRFLKICAGIKSTLTPYFNNI